MRTGTRTVRALSLMTSPPAMISGRLARTASRTFSSWRSQSRAPRENNSYHLSAPPGALSPRLPWSPSMCYSYSFLRGAARARCGARSLFLREQRGHVAQGLLGTVLVVAVFAHQALLHHRDLLARVIVGARGRSDQPQHVAALLEQVLLDRLAHARVTRQLEFLARLERPQGFGTTSLVNDRLPESDTVIFSSTERRKRSSAGRLSPVMGSVT